MVVRLPVLAWVMSRIGLTDADTPELVFVIGFRLDVVLAWA